MAYSPENPEPPRDFTAPDGTRWRRTGYCCRCGECCRGDPFGGTLGDAPIAGMCPLFALAAGGVVGQPDAGLCSDRTHHYYLAGCSAWPSEPAHIADKPGCTYRFDPITE